MIITNALQTVLCVGQGTSEVSLVSCTTSHFGLSSFLESRALLYKLHGDSDWQLNIDLAQSVEHWHDHQEALGSIPTEGIFVILLFSVNAGRILSEFGRDG